jgi:meiotic recombination protein SPO11
MSSQGKDIQDLTEHSAAAQGIENLVLSFLQQLVHSTDPSNLEASAHERRARCKIQLQLANRTTGCAKTLVYPKKSLAGSARPLGK